MRKLWTNLFRIPINIHFYSLLIAVMLIIDNANIDFNDSILLFFVDSSFTENGIEGCEDGSEEGGEDEEEV